jgi:peptide/nickel transport system permease protein
MLALVSLIVDLLPVRRLDDPDYLAGAQAGTGAWRSTISWSHPLGVDDSGNDLLALAIHGARTSMLVGLGVVAFALLVGATAGLFAGYRRGRLDAALVFATNGMLSIPPLLFLLLMASMITGSGGTMTVSPFILTLGALFVPAMFRVIRVAAMQQASREYVVAARAMGATGWRIAFRELVPNLAGPALAIALVTLGSVMIVEGSLAFLGAGLGGDSVSWGKMIRSGAGLSRLQATPNMTFVPALFLFVTVLALNLVGDTIRQRSNSREGNL